MCDQNNIDPLEIAQDVQMQRTRLKAFQPPVTQSFDVTLGGFLFHATHLRLHFHHLAGKREVTRNENGLRDA
ncbi:hypothetical protein ASE36_21615 [Rhizobium sp. Root274]|nr:hypothetical protein ASC71_21675 [Rhizobium sp. Root1240]KRD25451.1 hypothetical protein ASE36_21615 [Rhizobium sp. Root274]